MCSLTVQILPLGGDITSELEGEVARLTIHKVYPEDEGQYACVAHNSLGRAVTSACLIVNGNTFSIIY